MIKNLIHQICGQLCGEVWENEVELWGEVAGCKLSPINASCPQSYPQGFPPALQALIPQSTDTTTITTLINIYW